MPEGQTDREWIDKVIPSLQPEIKRPDAGAGSRKKKLKIMGRKKIMVRGETSSGLGGGGQGLRGGARIAVGGPGGLGFN